MIKANGQWHNREFRLHFIKMIEHNLNLYAEMHTLYRLTCISGAAPGCLPIGRAKKCLATAAPALKKVAESGGGGGGGGTPTHFFLRLQHYEI